MNGIVVSLEKAQTKTGKDFCRFIMEGDSTPCISFDMRWADAVGKHVEYDTDDKGAYTEYNLISIKDDVNGAQEARGATKDAQSDVSFIKSSLAAKALEMAVIRANITAPSVETEKVLRVADTMLQWLTKNSL